MHAHYLWKLDQKGLTQNIPQIAAQSGIKSRNSVPCTVPAGKLTASEQFPTARSPPATPQSQNLMVNLPLRQVGTGEGVHFLLSSTTEFSKMKMRFGTPRHCFVPCQNPAQVLGGKAVLCVRQPVPPRVRRRCRSQQPARPLHRHGVPADEDAFEQR